MTETLTQKDLSTPGDSGVSDRMTRFEQRTTTMEFNISAIQSSLADVARYIRLIAPPPNPSDSSSYATIAAVVDEFKQDSADFLALTTTRPFQLNLLTIVLSGSILAPIALLSQQPSPC